MNCYVTFNPGTALYTLSFVRYAKVIDIVRYSWIKGDLNCTYITDDNEEFATEIAYIPFSLISISIEQNYSVQCRRRANKLLTNIANSCEH